MIDISNYSPDYTSIINEGGFGDIYSCKQNRSLAIKMIRKLGDEYNGECNKKIIKKLLLHNNLMNIYAVDKSTYNDIYMIYMEHIDGLNLRQFSKSHNFTIPIIKTIIRQTLSGLVFLHKNKITHRDIKLDNIIINPNTNLVKIVDFGLAYHGYPCKNIVGTSGFFAPEMLYSINNYDSKCDIWSLGCVLYFMVCKYYPFYFNCDREAYVKQLKNKTEILFHFNKWSDPLLFKLCKNMLIYDYNKRFSSKQCLDLFATIPI